MKKYIFYTTDGYAYDSVFNEVENCQLLGFGIGYNADDAFNDFCLKHKDYMQNLKYENLIAFEVVSEPVYFTFNRNITVV